MGLLKTFILIGALGGLVVGTVIRMSGWSDEFSYAFSLTMLGVVVLVSFHFLDWERFDSGER